MAKFMRGDVVVVPFPFSDLSQAKKRPAFVVASLDGDDIILCQITSKTIKDRYAVTLEKEDFVSGDLKQPSNIRPNRIFTADQSIILYRIASLKNEKLTETINKIIEIIKR